jgi:putative flavoprotein involved in K+ transport
MSTTEPIETVVIGAGHAGLGVSRLLRDAGREHVVLERGRVAERWRTERWDSLHLVTPSWMVRLPGSHYAGPRPDSYLSATRFVRHLQDYAASFSSPVQAGTAVRRVTARVGPDGSRYLVDTDRGTWRAVNVVVATGAYGRPRVPFVDSTVPVIPSSRYRNPSALPPGRVLVVGASSSGAQIADELTTAGREVLLAVGRHTRMPRRYRGVDVYAWLEATGKLAQTIDQMPDPVAARREPSPQLVGRSELERSAADLDLGTLQARGVRMLGRLEDLAGPVARFRDDLQENVCAADRTMDRFLDVVDDHVARSGLAGRVLPGRRPSPIDLPAAPRKLDLRSEGVGCIVLAAGHRPYHPWLRVPVVDGHGAIRQRRGVTPAPGLYVVGQRFQHRRDSASIDGARHDAADVVTHLVGRALPVRRGSMERAS